MVDTGRYVSEDVYEEDAIEKTQEIVQKYNRKYDEVSIKEKDELQEEVWEELIKVKKEATRRLVFDEMKGSKKELKNSFGEWCERTFGDKDNQEDIEERYSEDVLEKAETLLEEEHILKKVKAVLDHRIAGEDVNKLGLFLQLLSKDTDDPLMIFGIQKQGEGKSYLAKNVIDLFPDHMVEKLTDATKSSIYRIAENEGKDFFDNKIVFFGEIPEDEDDREVFQIFRQLNSEGEVSKRLVMGESGDMESKKLELEGSPAVISTTVNEGLIDEQDMSRGMAYSPEMSQEQNRKVREFQNRESEFPEEVLNPNSVDEMAEVLECSLDLLAEDKVDLQNPFTRDFDEEMPIHSDNIKRDYPKTLQIASEMPAYLYHRQRPKKQVFGSEKTFVHWKDVARGLVINKKFINNMIRGHTESTMDAYKKILEEIEPSEYSYSKLRTKEDNDKEIEGDYFTNKDLEKWMGLAGQTAREYTRKLDKMELIFKDSSTKPHKHYVVDKDKSETEGITLSGLHNIIESVVAREELGDWARKYYEITDLEGDEGDILDKVAFQKEDLPVYCDFGLEASSDLPIPLYERFSHSAINEPTGVNIEMEDGVILCDFDSVSKTFSGKHDGKVSEDGKEGEQESEGCSEEVSESEEDRYSTGEPKNPPGSELWKMLNTDSWTGKDHVVKSLSHDHDEVKVRDYIGNAEWIEVDRTGDSDKIRRNKQKAKVTQ
jgi:hypothetical protein